MDNAYYAVGAERCCLSSSVGGIRAAFRDDSTNILFVPSLCISRCARNAQQTLRTEKPPPILDGCGFWRFRAQHEMQLPLGQLQQFVEKANLIRISQTVEKHSQTRKSPNG